MLACNKIANMRRRVSRARNFPHNTCPASRHVHMIADCLARKGAPDVCGWEADQVASSLYSVLESLWKLRAKAGQ